MQDGALRVDYRELFAPIRIEPHLALLVAAAVVLGLEALRGSRVVLTSPAVPMLQAIIAAVAFVLVWRQQDRLRLGPLLATGLAFQLAWIGVHLANGVGSDGDSSGVYAGTGRALLDGDYRRPSIQPARYCSSAWRRCSQGAAAVRSAYLMPSSWFRSSS